MFSDVLIPSLLLGVIAWITPVVLSRYLAEGLRPLMMIALLSTFILFMLSGTFFFGLYLIQGAAWSTLAQFGIWENLVFFGRLGLSSAMIWAPIMILSVMNRPRHWVKETW